MMMMVVMNERRRNTCLESVLVPEQGIKEDSVVSYPPLETPPTTHNYLMPPLNAVSSVLLENPFS